MPTVGLIVSVLIPALTFWTLPGQAKPTRAALSASALEKLVSRATAAHSDALAVVHRGELVGEWHFGKEPRTIETMSVTKSIVNLIVGHLVTVKKIETIDQPVWS